MSELVARLSLDSSQFNSGLSQAEARTANYSNMLGTFSKQGEQAFEGPSRGIARFAGHMEGANRTTFMFVSGLTDALERSEGDIGKFGQILGSTALYAGAVIGFSLIITKAGELSKQIDELNERAGKTKGGFLANLFSGFEDLAAPERMTSGFEFGADSDQYKSAVKNQASAMAKGIAAEFSKPTAESMLAQFIREEVDKTGKAPTAAVERAMFQQFQGELSKAKVADSAEAFNEAGMSPQRKLQRLLQLQGEAAVTESKSGGLEKVEAQEKYYRLGVEILALEKQINGEKEREKTAAERIIEAEKKREESLSKQLAERRFEDSLITMTPEKQKAALAVMIKQEEIEASRLDKMGKHGDALESQIEAEKHRRQMEEIDKKESEPQKEQTERLRTVTDSLRTIGGTVGEGRGLIGAGANSRIGAFDHAAQTARNTAEIASILRAQKSLHPATKPPVSSP
jgi:hypothetical protein